MSTTYPSYSDAAAQLPADARWSASFGNPGEGGYCEYHRDQAGRRYIISNGKWCDLGTEWTVQEA